MSNWDTYVRNNPLAQWTQEQVRRINGQEGKLPHTAVSTEDIKHLISRIDILIAECRGILQRIQGQVNSPVAVEIGEYDSEEVLEREALEKELTSRGFTEEQITAIMVAVTEGRPSDGNTQGSGASGKTP